ncbi:hypothetical protein DB891_07665 [Flavobacterium laiguense]|uniref:Uncharacterized protein n=1 Tax=Flavobacterium laiguense TaxID=2169409 RepID=A0A2U1JWF8_9FLAO|nr:hypothetical protein DB891_07665 [Flavobacterium laiguense]
MKNTCNSFFILKSVFCFLFSVFCFLFSVFCFLFSVFPTAKAVGYSPLRIQNWPFHSKNKQPIE